MIERRPELVFRDFKNNFLGIIQQLFDVRLLVKTLGNNLGSCLDKAA
jgi:hypothetical protein